MAVPQGYDVPFRMVKDQSSPNGVEGDAVFDRSIRTILRTYPGDRPYRPTFGSFLKALVFTNMTEGAALQAADEVRRAITEWEPRVKIDDIQFALSDTTVYLTIKWRANGKAGDSSTTLEF